MVPRDEVTELEMSVGDGMKMVISGGAVTPVTSAPDAATAVAHGAAKPAGQP
jgi:uncharacterized membrane protein